MTRDDILAMKPGREMDALVAESVAGERWDEVMDFPRVQRFLHSVPHRPPSAVAGDILESARGLRRSGLVPTGDSVCKGVLAKYRRWKLEVLIVGFEGNWAEALNAAEYYIAWDEYADKATVKSIRAETRFDTGGILNA